MSVVDFLFGGKAPTAGSSTTTTSIQLPAWYNEYASDILGKAKAIGDLPYATYTGPRIADFTATEREGFEKAKTAAGAYKPSLKEAYDALGASKKYSGLGAAEDALSRAEKMSGAGAARDYFSKAAGASGVAAAQPYLAYAARTFPEAAAEYMNPYTKAVVEQIADVGVKQLQEKYLPAVGEEFIRSGQFGVGPGSTRMGEFGARALRDVQQSVLGEQSKALQAGYGQAADIFARDVERISGIGGKIGQLTGDDASRLAEIGRAAGQLTSTDAELLSRIGSTRGELSLKDAENLRALADKYMGAAETEQVLGGREAKTYMDIGEKEREMKQKNLELAYKDFLEQEKDPERKIAFMAEILKSIQLPQTKVVDETTTPGSPGEDPLIKKIITGGAGIDEILELIKKYFPDKETPKGD